LLQQHPNLFLFGVTIMNEQQKVQTFINKFIAAVASQTELTDEEYKEAATLDWKQNCPDHNCRFYKKGQPYNPKSDPCIECQTDKALKAKNL
jgi:hypothetical protein